MIRQEIINALRRQDDALAVLNSEIWYERTADCLLRSDSKINADLIEENEELKKRLENSVELPCKVGTSIFHIYKNGVTEDTVFRYCFEIDTKPCVLFDKYFCFGTDKRVETSPIEQFNDCWFLTREQAEQRLKELRNENT